MIYVENVESLLLKNFRNFTLILSLFLLILNFSYLVNANSNVGDINNIYINEIMSNPAGNDNNKEFIEIKGTKNINLSSFVIGDIVSNDTLSLLRYCDECNYSLIVEENFDYTNLNCSIYSVGSTIGNGLSNTADSVYLYFNDSIISNVSYQDIDEGYSYSFVNDSWQKSLQINGTPCKENIFNIINNSNNTNISINISVNNSFNNSNNTSINISINETINISLSDDICNVSLELNLNKSKTFFYAGEKIKFKNILLFFNEQEDYDYTITYWIEDYFGNILKDKINTTNQNQKQWTSTTENNYLVARIKNKISFINCTNINNNTSDEFQFVVVNNGTTIIENREESNVEFEKIELSGKHLYVVGQVYKGDTTKTLFSIRFECKKENRKQASSQYFKLYFDKKFSTNKFAFRLPLIDILNDCYSDPIITYSGINLEGEADVDKFEFTHSNKNNEELTSEIQNNNSSNSSLKKTNVFVYSKTQDNINVSSYFMKITKETYFDALVSNNYNGSNNLNFETNKSYSKTFNDAITSNVAKDLEVKYKPLSFLNFAIIILFILILLALVLKKW